MSDRCDICGVEALEGQEFAEESLPFRRSKRYCPNCHGRLTYRICLYWYSAALVLGLGGLGFAWATGRSLLAAPGVWIALVLLFQWAMLVPHELGHALAARLLGYGQIRILIGSGKPIFTAELLGIRWLFNAVPFGGLTLAGRSPQVLRRSHEILFVSAGPAVSAVAAAVSWSFMGRGTLFDGMQSVLEAFFWANLMVLGENLVPYSIWTPYGRLHNDGLLLWNTIFRWGKPARARPSQIPRWEILLSQFLRWGIVIITGGATLLMGFLATVPFWYGSSRASLGVNLSVGGVCFVIMLVAGWITLRFARQPVARVRRTEPTPLVIRAVENLRARSQWAADPREADQIAAQARQGNFDAVFAILDAALGRFPNDVLLLAQQADYRFMRQEFARAEAAYEAALTSLAAPESAAHSRLLAAKLTCVLNQGRIDEVERACLEYLAGNAKAAEKIHVVDLIACTALYREPPQFLPQIERWTRMALQLAPGTLTLKGTLGGILVEQGNVAEAEPLLHECRTRSLELHDQAFASLYLGTSALRQGDRKTAKELFKNAKILHAAPPLLQKAELGLQECDTAGEAANKTQRRTAAD